MISPQNNCNSKCHAYSSSSTEVLQTQLCEPYLSRNHAHTNSPSCTICVLKTLFFYSTSKNATLFGSKEKKVENHKLTVRLNPLHSLIRYRILHTHIRSLTQVHKDKLPIITEKLAGKSLLKQPRFFFFLFSHFYYATTPTLLQRYRKKVSLSICILNE